MKTTLEITVRSDETPTVRHLGNGEYEISLTTSRPIGASHLWVRAWDPDNLAKAKDGKGFVVTPTRKLRLVK